MLGTPSLGHPSHYVKSHALRPFPNTSAISEFQWNFSWALVLSLIVLMVWLPPCDRNARRHLPPDSHWTAVRSANNADDLAAKIQGDREHGSIRSSSNI